MHHALTAPLRALVSAALLVIAGCQPPAQPPVDRAATVEPVTSRSATGGKLLLMHYMPWYKTPAARGAWGSHWTGHEREHQPDRIKENGLPDIWSHYHPLIGLYDSTDPDVLECHLLQMKMAGVDGVIVDWYGIKDVADYGEMQSASKALFRACEDLAMQFSVCYEDRSVNLMVDWGKLAPADITNHLVETFAWLQAEWFEAPHYTKVDGRPLVLNFGPMYLRDPGPWTAAMEPLPVKPMLFSLHHLWRGNGADGGFTWVHYDPWDGTPTPETIRNRIGEVFTYFSNNPDEVIVSAYPGFHDVYKEPHPWLEHRNGDTLRETLEVAIAGPWPIVQLVTWNDYGEGTMIEPTHEFGYTFLEAIQEARRREVGAAFTFTPEDLRLPAELLALRQAGAAPRERLQYVAQLIARGYTQMAMLEIAAIKTAAATRP